ncbi:hypothetical protein IAR55_006480 [Kwoniella newhampshirensis]|uniref:Anaphase-promoting complex subunit 4 WD40 domain-containing protein n=1 Tax=Kwoniella newhampshirensis TaxID=1651941 RepID=A0AAW0YIS3_9TREE
MSLSYLQQESTPNGHLRVWDANELSNPIHDVASHPLAISSLSTSGDGKKALAASLDGTVVLLDVEEGSQLAKVETGREKAAVGEHACWAWSGRSSKVAIRSIADSDEAHFDGDSQASSRGVLGGEGRVVDAGKGRFGMDLKFSPDGRSLALASEQGHVVVIDTETQAVVATYTSHNKAVRTISWSPDSQVAASPDGKLLGSGGADSMVKLWDVGQRSCVSTSTGTAEIWGLDWQPAGADTFAAGKQFAIAGDDKAVTLYRAAGSV